MPSNTSKLSLRTRLAELSSVVSVRISRSLPRSSPVVLRERLVQLNVLLFELLQLHLQVANLLLPAANRRFHLRDGAFGVEHLTP